MLTSSNVSATFFPSNIPGSKSFGYGTVDFAGVCVNYTAYPSSYGLGVMVSYPSRPRMKNGVQERDPNTGRALYINEVFVRDMALRNIVEEAVVNAMANKGVYTAATAAQAQQAGVHVAQVVQTPAPTSSPYSFAPPVAQSQPASNPLTFSPPGQEATPRFASPSQVQPPPVQPVVQPAASSARDYSYASNNSARCDEELPF